MATIRSINIDRFSWQRPVIDISNAPPGSPTKGDRYVVGDSPSGDWTGEDLNIAEYNGTQWFFIEVHEGYAVYVLSESDWYTFTGLAWVPLASGLDHAELLGLQGGITDEYYHLTSGEHSGLTSEGDASAYHHHDGRYYTQTNLQTSGQASVHWGNITDAPTQFTPEPHASTHHSGGSDPISPTDIGAEPSFAKGNLVQGTGVSLSGTLTERLVDAGDVTVAFDESYGDGRYGRLAGTNTWTQNNYFTANVGINTTSPAERLHVEGFARTSSGYKVGTTTVIDSSRNITAVQGNFEDRVNLDDGNGAILSIRPGVSYDGESRVWQFRRGGAGAYNPRRVVFTRFDDTPPAISIQLENLRLGVAMINPEYELDVAGVTNSESYRVGGTQIITSGRVIENVTGINTTGSINYRTSIVREHTSSNSGEMVKLHGWSNTHFLSLDYGDRTIGRYTLKVDQAGTAERSLHILNHAEDILAIFKSNAHRVEFPGDVEIDGETAASVIVDTSSTPPTGTHRNGTIYCEV